MTSHHRSDTASQPFFFHGGEQEIIRWCQIRKIWRVMIDLPIQSHCHAQQPLQPQSCVQENCPGETGLPSSAFQVVSEISLVLLFKILNYLSGVGLRRKQCSKYQERLNLMHAMFHCCDTTPY